MRVHAYNIGAGWRVRASTSYRSLFVKNWSTLQAKPAWAETQMPQVYATQGRAGFVMHENIESCVRCSVGTWDADITTNGTSQSPPLEFSTFALSKYLLVNVFWKFRVWVKIWKKNSKQTLTSVRIENKNKKWYCMDVDSVLPFSKLTYKQFEKRYHLFLAYCNEKKH